jgi:hypothetical protein
MLQFRSLGIIVYPWIKHCHDQKGISIHALTQHCGNECDEVICKKNIPTITAIRSKAITSTFAETRVWIVRVIGHFLFFFITDCRRYSFRVSADSASISTKVLRTFTYSFWALCNNGSMSRPYPSRTSLTHHSRPSFYLPRHYLTTEVERTLLNNVWIMAVTIIIIIIIINIFRI